MISKSKFTPLFTIKSDGIAGTEFVAFWNNYSPPKLNFAFFFSDHKYFKKISHIHLNLAESSQRQNRVQNSLTYALNEHMRTHGENGGCGVHPLACFHTLFQNSLAVWSTVSCLTSLSSCYVSVKGGQKPALWAWNRESLQHRTWPFTSVH